jgi:hypothetical protein
VDVELARDAGVGDTVDVACGSSSDSQAVEKSASNVNPIAATV